MTRQPPSKLMSATEAVAEFVHHGDITYIGFGGTFIPFALGYEVLRQRKGGLDIVGGTPGTHLQQLLFHAGVANRTRSGAIVGLRGSLGKGRTWQLIEEGKLQIEDYSNQTLTLMFMAAAMGMPFITTRSFLGTDFLKDEYINHPRGFLGSDKLKVIADPFTGQPVVALPALKPGVALWHAQRADLHGNAQAWGAFADAQWGVRAAERVIISAEEIVPTEVIRSDPNRTFITGAKVSAVVHEPFGAFPGDLPGYYSQDATMNRLPPGGFDEYLDEWVYGLNNHQEFMQHYVEKFGFMWLRGFLPQTRLQPMGTVDYGFRAIHAS
ncbi:MAG: CoA transferase subunit A [Chloroflexi bacterium]|nr:CoA transferase subunit A [Chloroflexota bacterium]